MTRARHVVAVVGGATAGAEVASRLAEAGAEVVVLEQNVRPFGKIEDGLPRWHVGLRRKEYDAIRAKLSRPGVHFVPLTRLGRDFPVREFMGWGFSAIVLANGAWRDRPLPLKDADRYVGRGLIFQNALIHDFNHAHDPHATGPRFEARDGIAVIGGGLASLDVVKLLMLETVRTALRARGLEAGPLEAMEQRGIPHALAAHGLALADLGLRGATLYYRRRIEDMPLADIPPDATPEKRARVEGSRRKIVHKAVEKFGFRMEPLCAPEELIIDNDHVVGIRLRRQELVDGKPRPTGETVEHRCAYVVSSIGSIPQPIPGIEMDGELLAFSDPETGRLKEWSHVFSTGNVVNGKGNIALSRRHAQGAALQLTERYLGLSQGGALQAGVGEAAGAITAAQVSDHLKTLPPPSAELARRILERITARQAEVGFQGGLDPWLEKHPVPPDDAA